MAFDPNLAEAMMDMAKEPVGNILGPPSQRIGEFLRDVLDYWMIPFQIKHEKQKIFAQHVIEQYRKEIEDCVAEIPEEELIPPRKSMLLSALEASENYIEEEELRKMFARLIAATFDGRKANRVHPSFAKIIQELSPLDAENLMCFRTFDEIIHRMEYIKLPVSKIWARSADRHRRDYIYPEYYFYSNPKETDKSLQSISLILLEQLGLICIDDISKLRTGESLDFKAFEKNKDLEYRIAKNDADYYGAGYFSIEMLKMYAELTLYGEDFCSVCLPPLPEEGKK